MLTVVCLFVRIFYWPGARFDNALLLQSVIMVGMQVLLLKIGLDNRPAPSARGGDGSQPFSGVSGRRGGVLDALSDFERPYNFWQWRSPKP